MSITLTFFKIWFICLNQHVYFSILFSHIELAPLLSKRSACSLPDRSHQCTCPNFPACTWSRRAPYPPASWSPPPDDGPAWSRSRWPDCRRRSACTVSRLRNGASIRKTGPCTGSCWTPDTGPCESPGYRDRPGTIQKRSLVPVSATIALSPPTCGADNFVNWVQLMGRGLRQITRFFM